jgi:hypothetical protein
MGIGAVNHEYKSQLCLIHLLLGRKKCKQSLQERHVSSDEFLEFLVIKNCDLIYLRW